MNISEQFEKYFIRPFARIANIGTLTAVRNSFILTLPVVMAGSMAVLINNLPISWYQTLMLNTFGEGWRSFGGFVWNGTFAVMSLVVCVSISYNMAVRHNTNNVYDKVDPLIASLVGFVSLMTIMQPQNSLFSTVQVTGVSGLFASIIVSLLASAIFIKLCKIKSFKMNFFAEEADFSIPNAISALFPALITVAVFGAIRTLLSAFEVPDLFQLTYSAMRLPFSGAPDSKSTTLLYVIVLQLLWFFGLHGANVLDPVTNDLYTAALDQNIAAFAANEPMVNVFTKTFLDVFVFMGGAGATICLLIAIFLFSKRESTRKIGQISLIPALFNINELLTFGLPIVLNPFFLVPFVLCPIVMCFMTYFFTVIGVLPFTHVYVDWTTPPILNAYYATGSIKGPLVQIFNLLVGMAIYVPFIRAYDASKESHFRGVYKKLAAVAISGDNEYSSQKLLSREDDIGAAARSLANDLQMALSTHELFLEFQPQVNVSNGKVFGVEALLRWRHRAYGLIPPPVMITIAEDSGMINELGLWVLDQATSKLAMWKTLGIKDLKMSVNLSVKQLADSTLPSKIAQIMTQKKLNPHELEIEVTESIALSANTQFNKILQDIHNLGVQIAVDDFGMGHSSLLYLRQFPVDVLKIDGSLSKDVLVDPNSADIIQTIVELCRSLDIKMIVEFIENEAQLEALLRLGARSFQGFLFSKPLPSDEVLYFIQKTNISGLLPDYLPQMKDFIQTK